MHFVIHTYVDCANVFTDAVVQFGIFFFLGCVEGDIRLLDGTTSAEGHVEICKNNLWGSICRNGWDNIDARVVCRQLGFSAAGIALCTNITC